MPKRTTGRRDGRLLSVAAAQTQLIVDVVLDVQSARFDGVFTYAIGEQMPPLGARVRVPLQRRAVAGWTISEPTAAVLDPNRKEIIAVEPAALRLSRESISLAHWLRRHYACTLREALTVLGLRAAAGGTAPRYKLSGDAPPAEQPAAMDPEQHRILVTLRSRFGAKSFAATSARTALHKAGIALSLSSLLRHLDYLVKARTLTRADFQSREPSMRRSQKATRVDRRIQTPTDGPPRLTATSEQSKAIQTIADAMRAGRATILLHGVTGSGKTFVYARVIEQLRALGRRAIVLVPEISLTPQTAARFRAAFGSQVGVLHSGLGERQRREVLADAAAGRLDVVVGARSAVFTPLPELRLIVIDEEHEPSYKQDVAPRYDTAAVARRRLDDVNGTLILGSATPSLETYAQAQAGAITYIRMHERATAAPLPPVQIVDMAAQSTHPRKALSPQLVAAVERALRRGEKALLFVNRRGYAGLLLCRACGFAPKCRRCAVSLVMHTADASMRCHICGAAYRVAQRCPRCKSNDLRPFGFGTQRVEADVRELFPHARVVRMDSDSTASRGAHGRLLESFGGDGDVLIGTQMIAKGLDFPTVTVVGVVSADIDLNRPEFRSAERTFALLTQVAGRAGRAAPGSTVIVQTYSPQHYAITLAAAHDYDSFARGELRLREQLRYPPYGRLAYIGVTADTEAVAERDAQWTAQQLRERFGAAEVLGPAFDPVPKARGEYRMRIAVKVQDEETLLDAGAYARELRPPEKARLTIIVDPR